MSSALGLAVGLAVGLAIFCAFSLMQESKVERLTIKNNHRKDVIERQKATIGLLKEEIKELQKANLALEGQVRKLKANNLRLRLHSSRILKEKDVLNKKIQDLLARLGKT
ncbi:MAG: hypothetical protein ACRCYY_14385 [Trueperaceae bacterium]